MRILKTPHTVIPEVHLLSNGNYHVMINNAGGGYSRWRDLAVTRWREDIARDNTGTFCYLRDVASNDVWSVGYQPTLKSSPKLRGHFPPVTGRISETRLRAGHAHRNDRFARRRRRAAPNQHQEPFPISTHD